MTGERKDLAADLGDRVQAIRAHTDLPLVVGFGISSPEQVREVASHADGVVVGSSGQLRRKRTRQSIGYCGKHRKKSR